MEKNCVEKKGMDEKFMKVEDVMEVLGISKSLAYRFMRQMNEELEAKGFITIHGKVSRKYFMERFYGFVR